MESKELLGVGFAQAMAMDKQSKKELDRKAIIAMAGKFHVTFDFAETFSPVKDYQREDVYKNESIEYIFVIRDEENFISLQHILVINDSFVVKHWRQDWIFENTELVQYDKDLTWRKKFVNPEEVAGTWTQKVYQVDDSLRYQSYGTWVYVDGKCYWESNADAPLPRRQEKRTDYNVLNRNHRVEITNDGWIMDQNNKKVMRNDQGEDQLIAWEKGFEIQNRGDYNCQPAIDYWEKNKNFWEDVRSVWDEIIEKNEVLSFKEEVDGKKMYEYFFGMVRGFEGDKYNQEQVQKIVFATIQSFLIK